MNNLICSDTPATADAARNKDFCLVTEVKKFEVACEAARKLAAALGDGWYGRVWENLGWHHEAISPCRRLSVYPSSSGGYHAMLHEPGSTGMPTYLGSPGFGKTPQAARDMVIRNAKKRVATINRVIEGL